MTRIALKWLRYLIVSIALSTQRMNERFEMGFPLPKPLLHTPKQMDDGVDIQKESVKKCVFVVCQCFCAVNIFLEYGSVFGWYSEV